MKNSETNDDNDDKVRLQKALAGAGVASRRAIEIMMQRGRIKVNDRTVQELGTRIDPTKDSVRVDGIIVQLDVDKKYFVLNKPVGVVSTMQDEHGRKDLSGYVKKAGMRLINVGRLDQDTSGLLILTNDGELAHKLAHPKFGVQKTYVAKVQGRVNGATIHQLKKGVMLEDGMIMADRAKLITTGTSKTHSLVEITLHSGRNRIVRRMLAEVGHPVDELVRRQFGSLHLGSLGPGQMRELTAAERGALLTSVADQKDVKGKKA